MKPSLALVAQAVADRLGWLRQEIGLDARQ